MFNMFENAIDWDRINNMSDKEVEAINNIFKGSIYERKPAFVVTDGDVSVTVYKDGNGWITCDNMSDDTMGLAYWEEYWDIIGFVCEYNTDMCLEAAWIEDMDGNLLEDDWED